MDVLWLAGEVFEPRTSGLYEYSGLLADTIAESYDVRFIGRRRVDFVADTLPDSWTVLAPRHRSNLRRALSKWPTKIGDVMGEDYIEAVTEALREEPRVVVIDHMRAAGVIDLLGDIPYVYVSHNDEWAVKKLATEGQSRLYARVAFWADTWKHKMFENRLLEGAALVTTITPEDAQSLGARTRSRIEYACLLYTSPSPRDS